MPKLAVLLRFPEFDSIRNAWNPTARLTRRGLARLESAARRLPIRLVADSDGLAAEYRQLTGLPVAALPIPHMIASGDRGAGRASDGATLRGGYLG